MAWSKENGPDGLPVWRGQDSLYNLYNAEWKDAAALARGSIGCVAYAFALIISITAGLIVGIALAQINETIATLCGVIAFFIVLVTYTQHLSKMAKKDKEEEKERQFIRSEWVLTASPDALAFKGGESWAVPPDTVARIETGRTAEYTPSRNYHPKGKHGWERPVPEHEWQTFLFLNDGTRRVIYHANADRDGCAALAASVRGWLESARAAAPAAPSQSSTARPAADGFDL